MTSCNLFHYCNNHQHHHHRHTPSSVLFIYSSQFISTCFIFLIVFTAISIRIILYLRAICLWYILFIRRLSCLLWPPPFQWKYVHNNIHTSTCALYDEYMLEEKNCLLHDALSFIFRLFNEHLYKRKHHTESPGVNCNVFVWMYLCVCICYPTAVSFKAKTL